MSEVLDLRQRVAADRVLAEEAAARRHLVVSLSGAHAYGFPSPDSDLDLKAIHVFPTEQLLGLSPPPTNAPDRIEVLDGVEIDYSSNELQPVLVGILQGNGNFIERVLSRFVLRSSLSTSRCGSLSRGAFLGGFIATIAASHRVSCASGRRTDSALLRSSCTCSAPRSPARTRSSRARSRRM